MENERLRITLSRPDKTYFAGQTIKGEIWMNLVKRTKIRAIKIQITGKGKCKWMEILRKNSHNESSHSLFYTSKEVYAHNENTLPVFQPRGIELSPDVYTFEFSVQLESYLPSSFKGSYGSIKYKMRVLIQRPWTFDERHIIPLTIVKHMPLPSFYHMNPTPLEKQITKTISLFGTRPITVLAMLPEDYGVRGEPFRVCVKVTNNSTTNVEKLRFSILQHIRYYSHVPLRIQKLEFVSLLNKETGAVHKKSERSFQHELLIPEDAQPSDDQFSGVINISYELRVEAVLRGFFKNIVLNLPFKVFSNEGELENGFVAPALPPSTYPESSGNPFERSTNIAPVYPPLDGAVGSPSHSSQYSESSCSINSTTSDSSAATLSPAMGGAELSYASGSSSQFNSPSTRASLRHSNVPYMRYSGSPLMVNSYPPHLPAYALPESPQYMLMSQSNATPPASQSAIHNQLPSTSLSFLHPRQPPGAHELPPSYEELFGNASAPPPETPK